MKHWWHSGMSGRVSLEIEDSDAESGYHQGACDDDIEILVDVPYIREQLDKVDKAELVGELKEYGAWDDEELSDHEQNLKRLLWLACADLVEEMCHRENDWGCDNG